MLTCRSSAALATQAWTAGAEEPTQRGVGVLAAGVMAGLAAFIPGLGCPEDKAAEAILASRVSVYTPEAEIIDRSPAAAAVVEFLDATIGDPAAYMVVEGPRGSGKTTLVERAAANRDGVITVTFNGQGNVFETIAGRLGVDGLCVRDEHSLTEIIMKAVDLRDPHDPLWRPTILAEVERGASDGDVNRVAKALKRLCVDCRAAHVVILLSEANAAFALPADPFRQRFLWVEDFTEAEAQAYLDARGFLVPAGPSDSATEAQRRRLFDEVGTRLAALSAAVSGGEERLESFITACQLGAEKDLTGLLRYRPTSPEVACADGRAFERLVSELLKHGEEGVPRATTVEYLASPADVSKVLREHHAVLYHMTSDTYRFYSPAHRRAAERRCRGARSGWDWGLLSRMGLS